MAGLNSEEMALFLGAIADPYTRNGNDVPNLWEFDQNKIIRIMQAYMPGLSFMAYVRASNNCDNLRREHFDMIRNIAALASITSIRENRQRFSFNMVSSERWDYTLVFRGEGAPNFTFDGMYLRPETTFHVAHSIEGDSRLSHRVSADNVDRTIEFSAVGTGRRGTGNFFNNVDNLLTNSFSQNESFWANLLGVVPGEAIGLGVGVATASASTGVGLAIGAAASGVIAIGGAAVDTANARENNREVARVANQITGNYNMTYLAGRFELNSIAVTSGDNRTIHIFEGRHTQKVVDVYNRILGNQNPPILFNGRQLAVADILINPRAVQEFTTSFDRDEGLRELIDEAVREALR